jgi:hypothetical protein
MTPSATHGSAETLMSKVRFATDVCHPHAWPQNLIFDSFTGSMMINQGKDAKKS